MLHADRLELLELGDVLLDGAEDAEAIRGLVVDELAVRGALAGMVVVVVELAALHVGRQRIRELRLVVALQQVEDVVRDHRREPAGRIACRRHVVHQHRGGADDRLKGIGVATGLLGGVTGEAHDPLDDLRVGELDDHALGMAPGHSQRLRAVARKVERDLRQVLGPLELELLAVPLGLSAVHQVLHHRRRSLVLGDLDGLQADVATSGVTTTNAEDHAATRDVVQRGVRRRGDGGLARARVRHAHAELDALRAECCSRQQRIRVLPQNVRVVGPTDLEAVVLGLLEQAHEVGVRRVGKNGDAEMHGQVSPTRPRAA